MEVIEGNFRNNTVSVEDVIDALEGVCQDRKIVKAIALVEEEDGTLLIIQTDMTNTELVGTLHIALSNYIHLFQHREE